MSNSEHELELLVKSWLSIDSNPSSRKVIEELWEKKDYESLKSMMMPRIAFGTAGLRSEMAPGFAHMNDVTVLQAAQGLVDYLLETGEKSIVIGYDHRYNSQRFAEITVSVAISKKLKVFYLGSTTNLSVESLRSSSKKWNNNDRDSRSYVHTPLVPFAVDHFRAGAGVMVTASHNPAKDNGYKVYYKNGCQIIPPHDKNIALKIEVNLQPWSGVQDVVSHFENGIESGLLKACKSEIDSHYIEKMKSLLVHRSLDFEFVYTPMHGVGLETVEPVTNLFENPKMSVVQQQAVPDPSFPTVKFPNPEESGALDLGIAQADREGHKLVVATDPDADRFSVAIKEKDGWKQLTGNEIGYLFAKFIIENTDKSELKSTYLVNSTVSSQILKSMAAHHGFNFVDTLTGFKWIGNKAIDLKKEGYSVPFGYEEAIGYMFGLVNDKDGISALVIWLQLYQQWFSSGKSVIQKLNEGYEKYGWHKECNGYYRVKQLAQTNKIFTTVRLQYDKAPTTIGDFQVVSWRDLTIGYDSSTPDNIPTLPVDPSSQMITGELQNSEGLVRFTVRGSGTEPKIKVYIEGQAKSENNAKSLAVKCWTTLRSLWFVDKDLVEVRNN